MVSVQRQYFDKINDLQGMLADTWRDYWQLYSNVDTWQFWIHAAFLVVPLIVLYFAIDRQKALLSP